MYGTINMKENTRLTGPQNKILIFIESQVARLGRPPTYRDIAREFGYEAVGTVQDHIRALIRKGFLKKESGCARGIRLTHQAESNHVPILGAVPAGRPVEAIEDRAGSLAVPVRLRGELFALKIKGESMIEAGILDGDYVIVQKQSHAENGEIVIALIDGEATVKYFEKRSGRVRLLPANPRFSPIEVPPHAENVIQGKVVSVQRFLI